MGKLKQALAYSLEAIQLTRSIGDLENLSYAYLKTGELYSGLKNFPLAIRYLDSCVNLSRKIRTRAVLEEAYQSFFKIYYSRRYYKKAIDYLLLQNQYHDSLMSSEIQKNVARLQIEFETERNKNHMASLEQKAQLATQKAKSTALAAKKQQYLMYLLISALVLALVLLAFGSFYLASRNKRSRLLEKKNKDIENARKALEKSTRELAQAKEKAEESDRSKSRFMASISHEIRTPLNAVIGYADILQNMVSNPKEKKYLEAIHSSGKSLLNLINDILDLSKLETGKFSIQQTEMNLVKLMHDVKNIFMLKAKEKNIDLQIEFSDTVPEVLLFDETRLRQILLNLVGNAIKFTESGYVKMVVNAEPDKEKHYVNLFIDVKDSGKGIPIDDQEEIFKPFEQGSLSQNEEGSGLGLSISKRLAEAMNGRISLKSQLDEGSIFSLIFNHVKQISPLEKNKIARKSPIEKRSLLFIHQDNTFAKSINHYLSDLGYLIIDLGVDVRKIRKQMETIPFIILCCIRQEVLNNTLRAIKNHLTSIHYLLFICEKEEKMPFEVAHHHFVKITPPIKSIYPEIDIWLNQIEDDEQVSKLFGRRNALDMIETNKNLANIYLHAFQTAKKTKLMNNIQQLAEELQTLAINRQMDQLITFAKQMLDNVNNFDIHALDQQLNTLEKAFQRIINSQS
jgi:signal transduction histidine kinase